MLDGVLHQLPTLGISGLLFVMWWFERHERLRTISGAREGLDFGRMASDVNHHLLDAVRANTDALAALREELRSHRVAETEWLSRLSRQLERLAEER
jgi:hypothetical protein